MILADLGADVIRIDRPGGQPLTGGPHDLLNRGRPSVALDLKHPDGVATVLDLVETADVLVEGLRPGTTERLGLGPDECLARNPRLVYGRMTGWGQDGPLAPTAGHDLGYIAITGALFGLGQDPGRPHFPSNLVGDFGGGSTYLVIGVLAALLESRLSGEGQVVDAAIVDGTAHLNAMATGFLAGGLLPRGAGRATCSTAARRSTTSTRPPTAGTWRSARSSRSSTTSWSPASASPTPPPTATTRRSHAELRAADRATPSRQRTQAEWAEVFDGTDACVAPVLPMTEAFDHPHLVAARHVRRARRHDPARAGAALLADGADADDPATGAGRPGHPRRPAPPGGSPTSTPCSSPERRCRPDGRARRRPDHRCRAVRHRRRRAPDPRAARARRTPCSRRARSAAARGTCSATPASARTPTCTRWATASARGGDEEALGHGPADPRVPPRDRPGVRRGARTIRYDHRVVRDVVGLRDARWTVEAEHDGEDGDLHRRARLVLPRLLRLRARPRPEFAGAERVRAARSSTRSTGPPTSTAAGKEVVVIGSGATAVTLVPAMARRRGARDDAAAVAVVRAEPAAARPVRRARPALAPGRSGLPRRALEEHPGPRSAFYRLSRRRPGPCVRRWSASRTSRCSPRAYDVDTHFTPTLRPVGPAACASCPTATSSRRCARGDAPRSSPSTIERFDADRHRADRRPAPRRRRHRHRDRAARSRRSVASS